MPLDEHQNILGKAIDQLVYELGFSSPNQLWDEAGETANRASWYKRVAPDSKVRTAEKHITKLINGLERNGHKLSQGQRDRLYAAIGVKVVRQEELDRMRRLEILKDPDRQRLFDARLARFVSGTRQDEIANVLKLIEQLKTSGGYLIISGRAGEGKTTMVCQLITSHQFGREQTPYHIIPFTPDHDHQVTLLHSLMASLALKHPYLSDFWTPIFHRDTLAGIFARMLREISAKGEQEVLFIDGLDQIKPDANMEERDLDFLPLEIPKGIVIVVSTRPDDVLKPLQLRSPLLEYKLPRLKRTDMDRILAHYEVHLGEAVVDQLYRATEQNALYVDLVAQELAPPDTNIVNPVEILGLVSSNPGNIFLLSMKRLKHHDKSWKEVIKPILGLLLAVQEPLSTSAIGQILALEDEALRDGLWRLGGLVEEDGSGRHYLYHLKLREYLREDTSNLSKEYVISQKEERLLHKQLADWCTKGDLSGSTMIWEDTKDAYEQERRMYARQYYITHLYDAQEWQRLFATLDEGVYGRAKVQDDPSMRFYALDLDLGRKAVTWEMWTLEEAVALLPRLWRYTLLRCSLTSRADNYTPKAFKVLLLLNRVQETLNMADLLTDTHNKVKVLLEIAKYIKKCPGRQRESVQILMRVREIATSIKSDWERVDVLGDLSMALVEVQECEHAEAVAQNIEDKWGRIKILEKLGRALIQAKQWERAEAVIRSLPGGWERDEILSELGVALVVAQQWEQVQALIGSIETGYWKSFILKRLIVAYILLQRWEQAKAIAHSIELVEERAEALRLLGTAFSHAQQWARTEVIWAEAEVAARSIQDSHSRRMALRWLGMALIEAQQRKRAKALAYSLTEDDEKTLMIGELGNALAQAGQWEQAEVMWTEAEAVARSIEKTEERATAFRWLAEILTKAGQGEQAEVMWTEAEAAARSIEKTKERAAAFCWLGEALTKAGQGEQAEAVWTEAERETRSIENAEERTRVFQWLGWALTEAQQWQRAEEIVSSIEERKQKDRAWRDLGEALIAAQQWERAATVIRSIFGREGTELMDKLLSELVQAQQWEQAEAVVRSIEDKRKRTDAVSELVLTLARAGQRERAKVIWAEAEETIRSIKSWPGKSEVLRELAVVFTQAQQWTVADMYWAKAEEEIRSIESSFWRAKALKKLVTTLIEMQQWERAETVADSIEEMKRKIEALQELASTLTKAGQWERAEVVWAEVVTCFFEIKTEKIPSSIILMKNLVEARQWERAEAVANSLQEGEESFWRILRLSTLSRALAQAHQWEKAEAIALFIENEDSKSWAFSEMGVALAQARQWEQAEAMWAKAEMIARSVEKSEKRAFALQSLGSALAQTQQLERVEAVLTEAEVIAHSIGEGQKRADALRQQGTVWAQVQQWERAKAVWSEAEAIAHSIEETEEKDLILENLGRALIQAQQLERAEAMVGSIQGRWKKDWVLKELVKALTEARQWQRAEAVARSIENWSDRERSLGELGMVLAQAQQWDRAESVIRSIDGYADLEVKTEAVGELLKELLWKQEWERAEALLMAEIDSVSAEILRKVSEALAVAGQYEQLRNWIQCLWLQASAREDVTKLLPLANGFIRLKPEIGMAFYEAFTWADNFLRESRNT